MMKRVYAAHHCDEMTDATIAGLERLLDEQREGVLDPDEIRALVTSPPMQDWVRLQASSFGIYAMREWAEGETASIASWFGTLRPKIREKLLEVALS